jgi:predicted PurR-regulated permease PerM
VNAREREGSPLIRGDSPNDPSGSSETRDPRDPEEPLGSSGDTSGESNPAPFATRDLELHQKAIVGLFVLAFLVALYVARAVVFPILLAFLFSLLLAPVVRVLRHLKIPRWIAAGLVVLGLVAFSGGLLYYLASPAAEWMDRAPRSLDRLESKLRQLKEPVAKVSRATEQVERMTDVEGGDGSSDVQKVQMAQEPLSGSLVKATLTVVSAIAVTLVLLYFLLSTGDIFLRKVASIQRNTENRHKVVKIARRLERDISAYLLTITLINVGLGVAVGLALWALDMPNPVLWGTMACLLNFVPYLGAMVGVVVVAVVAMLSFDVATAALWPPLAYMGLTALEGSFITPTIVGNRLTLNPLMIFAGIIFWGWMCGVAGALIAVPLLAVFKILCGNVESLQPVGRLLGR